MKKRCMTLLLACVMALSICACTAPFEEIDDTETAQAAEPDITQIRSICELATLECYYHNVAKSVKTKGSGLLHIGEKERTYWIEYTGVAKIGIDMSEVKMDVDGTNITIFIPDAKLINYRVEAISEDDYVASKDGFFNKNPITAEEQTEIVDTAQKEMKLSVEENTSLLIRAQERAKTLIENYVVRLGEAAGVEYSISWEYGQEETEEAD